MGVASHRNRCQRGVEALACSSVFRAQVWSITELRRSKYDRRNKKSCEHDACGLKADKDIKSRIPFSLHASPPYQSQAHTTKQQLAAQRNFVPTLSSSNKSCWTLHAVTSVHQTGSPSKLELTDAKYGSGFKIGGAAHFAKPMSADNAGIASTLVMNLSIAHHSWRQIWCVIW